MSLQLPRPEQGNSTTTPAGASEGSDDPRQSGVRPHQCVFLTITHEATEGEGQDAPPLLLHRGDSVALAVFDGLGGSGATLYRLTDDAAMDDPGGSMALPGAYLASRAAQSAARSVLEQDLPAGVEQPSTDVIADAVADALDELAGTYVSGGRIRSRAKRSFPTTIALGIVGPATDGRRSVRTIWAGDSRVFALDPELGLLQLSRDHAGDDEADMGMGGDAPMTRVVQLGHCTLDEHSIKVNSEAVVVAATDGAFAYWPSIMHFEQAVLASLMSARDAQAWTADLRRRIVQVTGDDATLSLAAPAYPDLAALQARFAARGRFIDHLVAFSTAPDTGDEGTDHLRMVWSQYREGYLALVAPERPGPPASDPVTTTRTDSRTSTGAPVSLGTAVPALAETPTEAATLTAPAPPAAPAPAVPAPPAPASQDRAALPEAHPRPVPAGEPVTALPEIRGANADADYEHPVAVPAAAPAERPLSRIRAGRRPSASSGAPGADPAVPAEDPGPDPGTAPPTE